MLRNRLEILWDMFGYILNIRLHEIMLHIAYAGVCFLIAYVIQSVIFGIPILIWEAITKKKIPFETKEKFDFRVTIILGIALILQLLYGKVR